MNCIGRSLGYPDSNIQMRRYVRYEFASCSSGVDSELVVPWVNDCLIDVLYIGLTYVIARYNM